MNNQASTQLPLQVRRQATNTNTTKENKKFARCEPPLQMDLSSHDLMLSEDDDDFPTPRANAHLARPPRSPRSPKTAPPALPAYTVQRRSNVSGVTEFEEDVESGTSDGYSVSDLSSSDAESIEVPFHVSNSVKRAIKRARAKQVRPPSLVIPSPSVWPRAAQSFHEENIVPRNMSLRPRTPLSPAALARLAAPTLSDYVDPVPHSTPSLGASSTDDENTSFSCPSTPDLRSQQGEDEWEVPLRLHPDAMNTLSRLSMDVPARRLSKSPVEPIILETPEEMQDRGLSICIPTPQVDTFGADDLLSAISIPSPGGFFASLSASSSTVWGSNAEPSEPNTSEAENFYGVPFRVDDRSLPQVIEASESGTDGPPTARRLPQKEPESDEYPEFLALDDEEIDETYSQKLSDAAKSSQSRTDMWIESQELYLNFLKNAPSKVTTNSGTTSIRTHCKSKSGSSIATSNITPSSATSSATAQSTFSTPKKSVRFADVVTAVMQQSVKPMGERPRDSILYHAFQHLAAQAKPRDAYIHRDTRAEALRMQRSYMRDVHRTRLRGSYNLQDLPQTEKAHWKNSPKQEDQLTINKRNAIANVAKEQRALQQLSTISWTLQAMRFLDGGSLLPQATLDALSTAVVTGSQPRVLDFGGRPIAGWGWDVAVEHRDVKVYTAIPTANGMKPEWLEHRGPSNHRIVTCPNAWTLPFPSGMFSVISARSLHSMLRTRKVVGQDDADEYDACIAELHRVLAPGGVLHFSLLDAEMQAPSNSPLATKGVEFAVSLRTHGYDHSAGRHIVHRLEKSGFGNVRRSWVSLPWASDTQQNNDGVTGLLGSLMWESWLLKLQTELGKPEEALLAGVAEALNEAKRQAGEGKASSWRVMMGCAMKMQ